MPAVVIGPRCNRRVTCDSSPSNARSESAIAVNPLDPYNLVGSSKRFTNPSIYGFSLAAYYTFDGGLSWSESAQLTLLPGWAGTTDPAVAWDDMGNAYLVALPFEPGTATDYTGTTIGIAVYKSTDGGRTWGLPNLIHSSGGDDKQWATGDISPASPYYGNVYAVWDNGSQLAFARTTDHGMIWKGVGVQPAGYALAYDSFGPELSVAADGTIYIVWIAGTQIKYVKSTDGGDSFSAPAVAASGISPLSSPPLPNSGSFPQLPGGKFRVLTLPTGCTGTGKNVIFAWADYREGVSRIYYRRSKNGGNKWEGPESGQPLLAGAAASGAGQHDFHPQIISTPTGEIGCAFYEFGPRGGGEFPPRLIDVVLAVSTDNGATFPNRVTVTDQAWDPAVDAPLSHGDPGTTFIGDYFGLDASRLGFFPFWTDTRTGVQEIFSSRIALNPADIYIRDSSSDNGTVPSPGFHWEAPDLIVRRAQDGNVNFVNEDLLRDGITDHFVYARVSNNGPNSARNVRLAVTVGNYPSLQAMPGTEFRYPQDWYSGDWATAALKDAHLFLGESTPVDIPSGASNVIIGPVLWSAADIPDPAAWHPCLLGEVRADNDDSAGGTSGCGIDADPDPCVFGSYFWGDNNVCQRNLSYAHVPYATAAFVELPFIVGSAWSKEKFLEVIVDKGHELAYTPMTLRMETLPLPTEPVKSPCPQSELVFTGKCRVIVRVDDCEVGEIISAPGTVWRARGPAEEAKQVSEATFGGEKAGTVWKLMQPRSSLGFTIKAGERRKATLSFNVPATVKPGTRTFVRIFQRNNRKVFTGSVILDLSVQKAEVEDVEVKRSLSAKKRGAPKRTRS